MIEKFSVGYNMEKNKRLEKIKTGYKAEESIRKTLKNSLRNSKAVLNEEVAEYLLNLGKFLLIIKDSKLSRYIQFLIFINLKP
jgi:hypothetical protein